jgi:hypothetical protein
VKLQEKEWFAERSPEIADAQNAAARKRMIRALAEDDPELHRAFLDALRRSEGWSHLMRNSGRYPLCAQGDINSYAVFAEGMRSVLNERGRVGCVLPTGIATDDTTKFFFQDVVATKSLVSLFDFENRRGLFPDVDSRMKFCLFSAGSGGQPAAGHAEYVFFAHAVEELRDPERRFTLSPDDIELLNPNTRTCPTFRSRSDAELAKAIYRRVPVLIRRAREGQPEENPWGIRFNRMFDMSNDSHLFRTREQLEGDGWRLDGNVFRKDAMEYLPLYEAKMIHQYDHRWAEYRVEGGKAVSAGVPLLDKQDPERAVLPRYWVEAREAHQRIPVESMTDRNAYPYPRRSAGRYGSHETPSSLQRSQTLGDADVRGNAKRPGACLPEQIWAKRPQSSMRIQSSRLQGAKSAIAQKSNSLPYADAYLDGSSPNLGGQPPADTPCSRARSFTKTDTPKPKQAEDQPTRASPHWLMGWRDIARSVDTRTTIADIIPLAAVGDQFLLMYPDTTALQAAALLGSLNSFVFDYVVRQKLGGIHLKYFTMKQTPVISPDAYSDAVLASLAPRVLELLYTGQDLGEFATECGWDGPPFRWDEERRFVLRCELDAVFFHLYLPADSSGNWRQAQRSDGCPVDETTEQFTDLKRRFPTPRDAVTSILV